MTRAASFVLRPAHAWFHWWEARVRGPYRVAAVVAGAAATAAVIHLATDIPLLAAFVMALLAWIGIGVVQEHADRRVLEVDPEFVAGVQHRVVPVVAPYGFIYRSATGGRASRRDLRETILFEAVSTPSDAAHPQGCVDIWIIRDRTTGTLDVSVDGRSLSRLVESAGDPELAERVQRTEGNDADVDALCLAFGLVLPLR
jgi:hypothetical protein